MQHRGPLYLWFMIATSHLLVDQRCVHMAYPVMEESEDSVLVCPGEVLAILVGFFIFCSIILSVWKFHHGIREWRKRTFEWILGVHETSCKLSITKPKKHRQRPPKTAVTQEWRRRSKPFRPASKQRLASGFLYGASRSRAEKCSVCHFLSDDAEGEICNKADEDPAHDFYKQGAHQDINRTKWPLSPPTVYSCQGFLEECAHESLLDTPNEPGSPSAQTLQKPEKPIPTQAPPRIMRSSEAAAAEGEKEKPLPFPSPSPLSSYDGDHECSTDRDKIGEVSTSSSSEDLFHTCWTASSCSQCDWSVSSTETSEEDTDTSSETDLSESDISSPLDMIHSLNSLVESLLDMQHQRRAERTQREEEAAQTQCETQLISEPKELQVQSRTWTRNKEKSKKDVPQGRPMRTTQAHTNLTALGRPFVKVPFLTDEAWKALEFHITQKKLHHSWGLPSLVLSCQKAFVPFPPDMEKGPREKITKDSHLWERTDVESMAQNFSFLPPGTKDRLEAHVRNMITKHLWGIPKQVQKSLKGFQCLLEEKENGRLEAEPMRGQGTGGPLPEVELPFLMASAKSQLEFHIQRKKIQHRWGLPTTVIKSLLAFAPFPFEGHQWSLPGVVQGSLHSFASALHSSAPRETTYAEGLKETGGQMTATARKKGPLRDTTMAPRQLHFLHPRVKGHLESHIQNLALEHRWRLPKLVHDSLRALIPQDEQEEEGNEDEEGYWTYHHLDHDNSEAFHEMKTKSCSSPEDLQGYYSELFHEVRQDRETTSWLVAEEPTFCPVTKTYHYPATHERMWPGGTEPPQKHILQRKRGLNLHPQNNLPMLRPVVPQREVLRSPFRSPSSLGKRRDFLAAGPCAAAPEGSQRARALITRSTQTYNDRTIQPRPSKTFLQKKKIDWHRESSFQARAPNRPTPGIWKEPQSQEDSNMRWESGGCCKVFRCPCDCHSSSSRGGSRSSTQSVCQEEVHPEGVSSKEEESNSNSSISISKESDTPNSGSAKESKEGSSLSSEDNGTHSLRHGFSLLPSEDNKLHSLSFSSELEEGSCALPSEDHEADHSNSAKGMESSLSFKQAELDTPITESKKEEGSSFLHSEDPHPASFSEEGQGEDETSESISKPFDKEAVPENDTLCFPEVWDSSLKSAHVAESNSSYEDIVARHYHQKTRKKQKTKRSSRLQRKRRRRSYLDLRGNFCHVLGHTATGSDKRVQSTSRGEERKALTPEARAETGPTLEPPQFPQGTDMLKDCQQHQNEEDAENEQRMAVIGAILERKLDLQEGLEQWKRNEGTFKDAWKKNHEVFLKERVFSDALQEAEALKNGSPNEEALLGVDCQAEPHPGDQAVARPKEEKNSAATEQSPRATGQGLFIKAFGDTRGREIPRSEGQPKEPLGEGHQAKNKEEEEAQERMVIIGTILERKLHLQEGLEIWRQNGGSAKNPWTDKYKFLLKEKVLSAAVKQEKILETGSEGDRMAVGGASTTNPHDQGHPLRKKKKGNIGEAVEKSLKLQNSGPTPAIFCRVTPASGMTVRKVGPRPEKKSADPLQNTGRVDRKEKTSILGRILRAKLRLFDRLKQWNWGKVSSQKEKIKIIKPSRRSMQQVAESNSPNGMQDSGLKKGGRPGKGKNEI